ncbi:S8 family serine peptidase [Endozoicomonas sp. Mp262]|uniref:S8 family peptidase n=1 Tax=Endozoicomonas sp. Mp262 TaxID=2919499 RepID=UPI0021D89BBA
MAFCKNRWLLFTAISIVHPIYASTYTPYLLPEKEYPEVAPEVCNEQIAELVDISICQTAMAEIEIPELAFNINTAIEHTANKESLPFKQPFSFIGGILSPVLTSPTVGLWTMVVGGSLTAAATLGGGGGNSSELDDPSDGSLDNTGEPDPAPVTPPSSNPADPSHYRTSEYLVNASAFDMIKLDHAYAQVYQGSITAGLASNSSANTAQFAGGGVTISILDTGVDADHLSLDGNMINTCEGDCAIHHGPDDNNGHGTHVAGIVAAEKDGFGTHGIAHDATILPGCANLSDSCQPGQFPSMSELLRWSTDHNADIANVSLEAPFIDINPLTGEEEALRATVASDVVGFTDNYSDSRLKSPNYLMLGTEDSQEFLDAKQAFEQGLIVAVAAGNHIYGSNNNIVETSQAGIQSMAPLIYNDTDLAEDLEGQWIAVVNIAPDLSLADSSHACGDAQNFCMAAPGTNILSTYPDDQHAHQTGTSMATPFISGSLALLKKHYPTIRLPETDALATVCNSANSAYNAAQCHSKAIVNRLFTTATDLGEPGPDPIYGRGLLNLDRATELIGVAQVTTIAGDRHDLRKTRLTPSPAMGNAINGALASVNFIATDSYDNAGFNYTGTALIKNQENTEPDHSINTLEYLHRSLGTDSSKLTINNSQLTLTTRFQSAPLSGSSHKNSYRLGFTQGRSHIELTTAFSPELDFGMPNSAESGLGQLSVSNAFNSPYSHFNEESRGIKYTLGLPDGYHIQAGLFQGSAQDSQPDNELDTTSFIMQLTTPTFNYWPGKEVSANLQLGTLEEASSWLGTSGSGAWSFNSGSDTLITGINIDYKLNTNTHLLLSYFYSRTDGEQQGGLLKSSSQLFSTSFSAGLMGSFGQQWQYGFFVTQPLRLTNGSATLTLPTGYEGYNLAFSDIAIDLAPKGRHLEYELALSWKPEYLDYVRLNILRVEDYGNIPGNDDSLLLFSTGTKF